MKDFTLYHLVLLLLPGPNRYDPSVYVREELSPDCASSTPTLDVAPNNTTAISIAVSFFLLEILSIIGDASTNTHFCTNKTLGLIMHLTLIITQKNFKTYRNSFNNCTLNIHFSYS